MIEENWKYEGNSALRGNKLFGTAIERAISTRDYIWLTDLAFMSDNSLTFMKFHVSMIRTIFFTLPFDFFDDWLEDFERRQEICRAHY